MHCSFKSCCQPIHVATAATAAAATAVQQDLTTYLQLERDHWGQIKPVDDRRILLDFRRQLFIRLRQPPLLAVPVDLILDDSRCLQLFLSREAAVAAVAVAGAPVAIGGPHDRRKLQRQQRPLPLPACAPPLPSVSVCSGRTGGGGGGGG
eukprot:SAG22_NODE_7020_length_785_cov_0.830904_1_plen_149_part_10